MNPDSRQQKSTADQQRPQRLCCSGAVHRGVRHLFLFCLLLVLPVDARETLRVLSLNAEWFPGRMPESAPVQQARHMVSIQQLLHDVSPDVWMVQEVNSTGALSTVLAVLPDLDLYAVSAFEEGPHQMAIAGRLPVLDARWDGWAVDGAEESAPPRGIVFSAVALPDDSVVLLFTLHLKSNYRGGDDYNEARNVAVRERSAALFVDYAAQRLREYDDRQVRGILLGGDFNLLYPAQLYAGERTAGILEAGGYTHLGSDGLDHFRGIGFDRTEFRVLTEYNVSDHRPVLLEIELPDGLSIPRGPPCPLDEAAALAGETRTDINTASLRELQSLSGIGPVLSRRIAAHRPFGSIEELTELRGIGSGLIEKIRPYIRVTPPPASSAY
jgi:competence ComEA-like helix-hairpin-helix protein